MEQREINRLHIAHLGVILNNFAALGGAFLFLTAALDAFKFLYLAVTATVVCVLILILLLSLLTLYKWFTELQVENWFNSAEFFDSVKSVFQTACPYVFSVTAVCAVVSVALLAQDKTKTHAARIVISVLALIAGIAATCVTYL